MTFASTDFGYMLFLEPGDEIMRCLIQFARAQEIETATLQGAGLVAEVELGSGRASDHGARRRLVERLEARSLTGSLTLVDGEPFPSLRGSFARADCSVVGGEVFDAVCGSAIELAVRVADTAAAGAARVQESTHLHGPGT